MERKNIPFQYGIQRSPSAAYDGELSECINLEAHNGELTPSVMPEVAFTMTEGDKLLFVHKFSDYNNFIIQRGESLCWFPDDNKGKVNEIGMIIPTSIHSVGNTLIVLSADKMEYILFKSGNYKRIGSKPPFCSISFGLESFGQVGIVNFGSFTIETSALDLDMSFQGGIKSYIQEGTEPNKVSFLTRLDEIETGGLEFSSKYVNAMTESIFPIVNKIVSANRRYGKFMHPFYLRYAYRMYDGSHYMQSAPIFFPVNMKGPVCTAVNYSEDEKGYKCSFKVDMDIVSLNYSIVGFYDEKGNIVSSDLLKDWEDIVKGVDIFASDSIYPYKQDGYITGYWGTDNIYGASLRSTMKIIDPNNILKQIYRNKLYSESYPKNSLAFTFEDNPDFNEQIKYTGQFFKISEFKDVSSLKETVSNSRIPLVIEEHVLSAIEQQEILEDDYDSNNSIIPSFAYVYNGRLNISGIRTKLFSGYPIESMVPYTYVAGEINYTWHVKSFLEVEGREVAVVSESNILLYENPAYIYYPSTLVKKFQLHKYDKSTEIITSLSIERDAEVHKLLNGAYWLSPTFGTDDGYTFASRYPQPSGYPYLSYPNKIYTSEVNNPFYFPLTGRNSVGTGEIIAISSNAKAISPGQFGQYPLIVFSTDGIWAMQTGTQGLYESVHPISKDICVNPNVLQTNGPILFATHNGLHAVMSEQVENLSKQMRGVPETVETPVVDEYYSFLRQTATDNTSFNEFIANAFFADDYINNRAVIYNPDKGYAYIYCLDCGMFSKMVITKNGNLVRMQSVIRAYPEVYMQSGADIYTFVPYKGSSSLDKGLMITRPITLDDTLSLKVLNDAKLIYRKTNSGTRCRYALYVSNDGLNWKQCTSLRGHSFKFFRLAVFSELTDSDALQGISVLFDYRRTNKLR